MTKFVEASSNFATMKEAVTAALDSRVDSLFGSDAFIGEMYKSHPGRKDHPDQKKHDDDEEAVQSGKDCVEDPAAEEKGGDVKGNSARKSDD